MTQRSNGFRAGIQAGATASSAQSITLEGTVRAAAERVRHRAPSLTWRPGYSAAEVAEMLGVPGAQVAGVQPDGGIWVMEESGRPVIALEAKKQGAVGNAIERWYKNYAVLQSLGCRVYVTFCSGEGFFDDNSAQRIIQTAVALDPAERHRLVDGKVRNTPMGGLWLYRYRDAGDLTAAGAEAVIDKALKAVS